MRPNFIDRTGEKYGKLTVIKLAEGRASDGCYLWECRCDCGNEIIVNGSKLASGESKACGCRRQKPYGESVKNGLIASYRCAARRRKLIFDLTEEDFYRLVAQECFYCGCLPSRTRKHLYDDSVFVYNGIDRMDNSAGYTLDNVVTCCMQCNYAKKAMDFKEFLDWIDRLAEQREKRK